MSEASGKRRVLEMFTLALLVLGAVIFGFALSSSEIDAAESALPPLFKVGNTLEGLDGMRGFQIDVLEIDGVWVKGMVRFDGDDSETILWLPAESVSFWAQANDL